MFPWLNSSFQNSPQYHLCRRFLPPSLPGAQPRPSKCRRYTVLITVTLLKCAWDIGRIRDCMKKLRLFSINVQPTWNSRALNLSQSSIWKTCSSSTIDIKIQDWRWQLMCYALFTPDGTEDFINIECEHTISFFYGVSKRCRDWCIIFSSVILFLWLTVFA